ncbi:hypothetical protein DV737_g830, partial [Chaetothyriales sp. CBS 132003]
MLQSMSQLEYHFNRHHHYPWHFFSEIAFTPAFINATSSATDAPTFYHLIPRAHWSMPNFISRHRFMQSLDYVGALGVGKGHMVSYRHMCRWNSRFFYRHPALRDYDYYWRVEPDVHFFCSIPYDPFALFAAFGFVYGFNMAILDDARSFPSLWPATRDFVAKNRHLLHPEADPAWLFDLDPVGGGIDSVYNNCQFFSNFELGDLNFFRGNYSSSSGSKNDNYYYTMAAHDLYVRHLDHLGGFFYERFGDAPIHTLSVSLFAPRDRVWWFGDIGYQHDSTRHCPPPSFYSSSPSEKHEKKTQQQHPQLCACEPTPLDENFYKLVPMQSPQRKPADTCLRMWLERSRWFGGSGGSGNGKGWLEKKPGWDRDVELAWGGDGYGGYVRHGL